MTIETAETKTIRDPFISSRELVIPLNQIEKQQAQKLTKILSDLIQVIDPYKTNSDFAQSCLKNYSQWVEDNVLIWKKAQAENQLGQLTDQPAWDISQITQINTELPRHRTFWAKVFNQTSEDPQVVIRKYLTAVQDSLPLAPIIPVSEESIESPVKKFLQELQKITANLDYWEWQTGMENFLNENPNLSSNEKQAIYQATAAALEKYYQEQGWGSWSADPTTQAEWLDSYGFSISKAVPQVDIPSAKSETHTTTSQPKPNYSIRGYQFFRDLMNGLKP